MTSARSVGVEEELLLVDARTGDARSAASRALRLARVRHGGQQSPDAAGGSLGAELQEQQIETDTTPTHDLADLEEELRCWRREAELVASADDALVLASGTAPMPVRPRILNDPRYARIADRFGLTANEQLSCGCHVHVSVESRAEGVAVLDRIRTWLPLLLAVSANSPYWQGKDSGYASYRSQVMDRWPTSGPTELFGSAQAYDDEVRRLVATRVALDEAMVYFDARLSERYPTVEIRVSDVCLDVRDTVLVAALARAMVATAAAEARAGHQPPAASAALIRLATWRAGRDGVMGALLDPRSFRPRPAADVLDAMQEWLGQELEGTGDLALVTERLGALRDRGTGSEVQRRLLARSRDLRSTVRELARRTTA